ncbi:MAG: DNA repair protein RecO [Beijerinckiaceae bacterium]|nr:DNA repair protein RecO [Beijerinckiaceae bacterium]
MEWRDEGIILSLKRHGETSLIAEVMTREHGRHLGIVRGGRGKRLAAIVQPGNSVDIVWRARIEEHLGQFALEGLKLRSAELIASGPALYALSVAAAHLRLLPERDPHQSMFETLEILIEHLGEPQIAAALLVRFEVAMLAELGFGIDLSACAATGATQELVYVSPKSGRAVSRAAGEPYKDRLLPLPGFLNGRSVLDDPTPADLSAGFAMSGYFFERHVLEPRQMKLPEARAAFLASVLAMV